MEKNIDKLILDNENLIYYVIKKSKIYGEAEELYGYGMIGLVKAANGFDDSKNMSFSSYAYSCIRNEIYMYFRQIKRQPQNPISLSQSIECRDDNLCVEDLIPDDTNLEEDLIHNDMINKLYDSINKLDDKEKFIIKHLYPLDEDDLDDKEKFIIKHLYPLDEDDLLTQRDLAKILNTSQVQISRIKKRSINKLKKLMKDFKD